MIITIGREFGSEGHEIGKELSQRLEYELYDKDLLALAEKESGIDINVLAGADETIYGHFLSPYMTIQKLSPTLGDQLFQIQSNIIHNLAEKGNCIIIGRLADFILKDREDCIKAFIFAPFEARVKIIMEKHGISENEAAKLTKKMDAARKSYYSYYSDGKWSQKEGKDIMLNRAAFGIRGCVDLLEMAVKQKTGGAFCEWRD